MLVVDYMVNPKVEAKPFTGYWGVPKPSDWAETDSRMFRAVVNLPREKAGELRKTMEALALPSGTLQVLEVAPLSGGEAREPFDLESLLLLVPTNDSRLRRYAR